MDNKTKYLAVAVVAIVIIAAAAAFVLTKDNGDKTDNSITFLIQDNKGVYFWIEGEGDTAIDAFKDAIGQDAYKDAAKFVPSTDKETGKDNGIKSLYDLSLKSEEKEGKTEYTYWTQYVWTGSEWGFSQKMMGSTTPEDCNHYMAVVYTGNSAMPIVTPSDAKVWDGSTSGVLFTIKSESGMEFYINGSGKTMMDAFKDATNDYKVPFKPSTGSEGDYGVDSIFGIEGYSTPAEEEKTTYYYWSQYYKNDGDWEYGQSFMSGISSSDYKQCLIVFESMTF